MPLTIFPINGFSDNLFWMIKDDSNYAIVIDPGDATKIIDTLSTLSLTLDAILITHHHWDHTGGINGLLALYDILVYGPDSTRIPTVSHKVKEGDCIDFFNEASLTIHVIETPGHTAEDLSYHATIGSNSVLFCGDTLLGAACGRIFDGSHRQLHHSLQKINTLPEHTQIYCVHEFTLSNLKFAEILEPDNNAIEQRIRDDTIK